MSESVALAGPRNRDVYTGIDIWGRKYLFSQSLSQLARLHACNHGTKWTRHRGTYTSVLRFIIIRKHIWRGRIHDLQGTGNHPA